MPKIHNFSSNVIRKSILCGLLLEVSAFEAQKLLGFLLEGSVR